MTFLDYSGHDFNRYIEVTTQFIAFHKYEDAPDEVAFLKHRHRHVFKVSAHIEVYHSNRDLEFFTVQELMDREIIPFLMLTDNPGSCEMIAEGILKGLMNAYGDDRYYNIKVSEDGENAGIVEWDPDSFDRG